MSSSCYDLLLLLLYMLYVAQSHFTPLPLGARLSHSHLGARCPGSCTDEGVALKKSLKQRFSILQMEGYETFPRIW